MKPFFTKKRRRNPKLKNAYKLIPKSEAIDMLKSIVNILEKSDEAFVLTSIIDFESGSYKREKNSIEEGINLVSKAQSVIFSNTPVMGSLDLYSYRIENIKNIKCYDIYKNLLFPLIQK